MFIQLFPIEIVDKVWFSLFDQHNNVSNSTQLSQILLIAFATSESFPAKIRSGEYSVLNKSLPQKGTLFFTLEFARFPAGVISQLVDALMIDHVVIKDVCLVDLFFAVDFQLCCAKLKSITIVNLSESSSDLSNVLYVNNSIEELTLVNICEDCLPTDLRKMNSLKKLQIINSPLKQIPIFDKITNEKLEILILENTDIEDVDLLKCPIENLQELKITFGEIAEIKNLNILPNLRCLDLSRQQIKHLDLTGLIKLEVLIARRNKMTRFPEMDKSLNTLKVLDLSFNAIEIPSGLGEFSQLEDFIFLGNYFGKVDQSFNAFNRVFKLDISHNDIFKIDVGIHNFKRLNFLNLENNNLESIEEVILNIPKEDVEVKLRGNNLANSEKLRLINLESKIVSL